MILGGSGQVCLEAKEAIKALKSQKLKRYGIDFAHAASYLLKLEIDYISLGGCGQACPGMPKEDSKTYLYWTREHFPMCNAGFGLTACDLWQGIVFLLQKREKLIISQQN